jgi:hypothetical protein
MRGFLIFLAVACPIVLASPTFWSLVNMEFGAERVGYTRANGVTQWAWLGPMSPWPHWAMIPQDGKLTVRAHFEAAPGESAAGFGDVELKDASARGREDFVGALQSDGWTVQVAHFDTLSPDLPPRPMHFCIVEARKGARGILFSYDRASGSSVASLHWAEGKLPETMKYAKPGPC